MLSTHIVSTLKERLWLFQLKYSPFYAEWMVAFLPLIWLITIPYWLPKFIFYLLEDKNPLVQLLIMIMVTFSFISFVYVYVILGKPDQEKWKNDIFNKHIERIAIKVYDLNFRT